MNVIAPEDIAFNAERTEAWLVGPDYTPPFIATLDRLCDHCEKWFHHGDGTIHSLGKRDPECDGTGRNTLMIEVECTGTLQRNERGGLTCDGGCADAYPWGTVSYRAHIRPGMVAPVVQGRTQSDALRIELLDNGKFWLVDGPRGIRTLDMPASTKVGDWAVLMDIHP